MEKEGIVSIWVGNFTSEDELWEYVDIKYNDEDDDWEESLFLEEVNIDIDDIDEDFIEKFVQEISSNKISELLKGCSYEDVVIPNIVKLRGERLDNTANAVILMYNFEYENEKDIDSSNKVQFVGSVSYI